MYPLDRDRAATLAAQIEAVDGVAALYPGKFGEITLLYPQVRVPGIRFSQDEKAVTIYLVADVSVDTPLPHAADEVREIAATALPDHTINIIFSEVSSL